MRTSDFLSKSPTPKGMGKPSRLFAVILTSPICSSVCLSALREKYSVFGAAIPCELRSDYKRNF